MHADHRMTAAGRCPAGPKGRWAALALAACLAAQPVAALAQGAPPPAPGTTAPEAAIPSARDQQRAEVEAAWKAALAASIRGPATVQLLAQATLALPAGMIFVPKEEAARMLRSYGNTPGPALVGLVTSPKASEPWIVNVSYVADGYVKDDDAAGLKADDVLANLKEGQEESNKERMQRGFPELQLLGWTAPPAYDAMTHRLTWSLRVKTANETEQDASINFNTRALGREGYFSLNLVTEQGRIAQDSKVSAELLSGLSYVDGKRYADYNSGTDRVAEYGLAALIGVVAAKKLGLIALAAAFLLKFAKIGIFAVVGLGVAAKRLFRRAPKA